MEGLANPNPSHKIRSEFLATLWFAQLMSDEQVATVLDNKIDEVDEFLKLIDEFESADCQHIGPGAQFVAGFGKHMANAMKQYITENRQILADLADSPVADVKSAVG